MNRKSLKLPKQKKQPTYQDVVVYLEKHFPTCSISLLDHGVAIRKAVTIGALIIVGKKSITIEAKRGLFTDISSSGDRDRQLFVGEVYSSLRRKFVKAS